LEHQDEQIFTMDKKTVDSVCRNMPGYDLGFGDTKTIAHGIVLEDKMSAPPPAQPSHTWPLAYFIYASVHFLFRIAVIDLSYNYLLNKHTFLEGVFYWRLIAFS
jgi:hypothetical protein